MQKKSSFYTLVTLLTLALLILSGCQMSTMTPPEEAGLKVEQTESGEDRDVYKNGINQSYLAEMGITEEELIAQMRQELESAPNSSSPISEVRSYTQEGADSRSFNNEDLAGAMGKILYNIAQNPGDWIRIKDNISIMKRELKLDVGLNMEKLKYAISVLPSYNVEAGGRQHLDFYGFSLDKIQMTSQTSCNITIGLNVRYRKYIRLFWADRKIVDVRGSATVDLPVTFDTSKNDIVFTDFKVKRAHIPLQGFMWLNPLVSKILVSIIKAKAINKNWDINRRISFNFIEKAYTSFNRVYLQYEGSKRYLYFGFKINTKAAANSVLGLMKKKGIKLREEIKGPATKTVTVEEKKKLILSGQDLDRFFREAPKGYYKKNYNDGKYKGTLKSTHCSPYILPKNIGNNHYECTVKIIYKGVVKKIQN